MGARKSNVYLPMGCDQQGRYEPGRIYSTEQEDYREPLTKADLLMIAIMVVGSATLMCMAVYGFLGWMYG